MARNKGRTQITVNAGRRQSAPRVLEGIVNGTSAVKWTKASLKWGQMREPEKNKFFVGPRSIIIHSEVPLGHCYLRSGFIVLGFCLYQFFSRR